MGLPSGAEVFVPDSVEAAEALARTTHLGVGAHPDDLEIVALPAIVECFEQGERCFTGVVCTDGRGSARTGALAGTSEQELVGLRAAEQQRAAEVGRYSAVLQLGHLSSEVRSAEGRAALQAELREVLEATTPEVVFTHNPVDRHPTHLAVVGAVVEAARGLERAARPRRIFGVEAWRGLDWLAEPDRVRFDVSGHADLARELLDCFPSQYQSGKRLDRALVGRRWANATLDDPHRPDEGSEVVLGVDLSGLLEDDEVELESFVSALVERFQAELRSSLRDAGSG